LLDIFNTNNSVKLPNFPPKLLPFALWFTLLVDVEPDDDDDDVELMYGLLIFNAEMI
jgi:hypothetical protein